VSSLHTLVRAATGPAKGRVVLMHGVASNERSLQAPGVAHELRSYAADHALTPAMQADFTAWSARQLLSSD
jgi:hypothetical protein